MRCRSRSRGARRGSGPCRSRSRAGSRWSRGGSGSCRSPSSPAPSSSANGPATSRALGGGLLALVAALAWRGTMPAPRFALGAWAAAAFVLPVVAHGVRHWSPAAPSDPLALSPRLLHNLRTKVPKGAVVLAPVQVSYRIEGGVPVYVVAAPLAHVANTRANHAVARYRAVHHWVLTSDPRVAARYGATWAIRRGRLYRLGP